MFWFKRKIKKPTVTSINDTIVMLGNDVNETIDNVAELKNDVSQLQVELNLAHQDVDNLKLCSDCVHYAGGDSPLTARCLRATTLNPVDGSAYVTCASERANVRSCSMSARFFQLKEKVVYVKKIVKRKKQKD